MVKSMTGYGKAQTENESFSIQAELKTLNSKYLDATVKLPRSLSSKEIEVRNMLSEKLQRGKVLLVVNFIGKNDLAAAPSINKALLKTYYQAYREVAEELQDVPDDLFQIAASSPDVVQPNTQDEMSEELWKDVKNTILEAIARCSEFRQQEGEALQKDMEGCINSIKLALDEVQECVPNRDAHVRERLRDQLNQQTIKELIDENRFEQEMIYYLEKLDVNEEIIRLTNHLDYFLDIIRQPTSQGKKLGFISQEIGREINTIGSKANDSTIQRHVVTMKEELEKIKEQALNIL